MKKFNVIIDTDPGVDDAVAIIPALFNKNAQEEIFSRGLGPNGTKKPQGKTPTGGRGPPPPPPFSALKTLKKKSHLWNGCAWGRRRRSST